MAAYCGKLWKEIWSDNGISRGQIACLLSFLILFSVTAASGAAATSWLALTKMAQDARKQGEYNKAQALYEQALAEACKFGMNDPRYSKSLRALGDLYFERNRFSQAEQFYLQETSILQPLGNSLLLHDLFRLGVIAEKTRRFSQARDLYARALAVKEQALGKLEEPDLSVLLLRLITMEAAIGDWQQVDLLWNKLIALKDRRQDTTQLFAQLGATANDLHTCASKEHELHRQSAEKYFAISERIYAHILDLRRQAKEPDYMAIGQAYWWIADVCEPFDKRKRVEYLKGAYSYFCRRVSARSELLYCTFIRLIGDYFADGKAGAGELLAKDYIARYLAAGPDSGPFLVGAYRILGDSYASQERTKLAIDTYKHVISMSRDCDEWYVAHFRLIPLLSNPDALKLASEVQAKLAVLPPKLEANLTGTLTVLCDTYGKCAMGTEAQKLSDRYLPRIKERKNRVSILTHLAQVHQSQNIGDHLRKAEQLLREAITLQHSGEHKVTVDSAWTWYVLGTCLLEERKYAEALNCFETARACYEANNLSTAPAALCVLDSLCSLYVNVGKIEQAKNVALERLKACHTDKERLTILPRYGRLFKADDPDFTLILDRQFLTILDRNSTGREPWLGLPYAIEIRLRCPHDCLTDLPEASRLAKNGLKLAADFYGRRSPKYNLFKSLLAGVCEEQHEFAEAAQLRKSVLLSYNLERVVWGEVSLLARDLSHMHREKEAWPLYRQMLARRSREESDLIHRFGSTQLPLLKMYFDLGRAALALKQYKEAESDLNRGAAGCDQLIGYRPMVSVMLIDLARAYFLTGRTAKAAAVLERAYAVLSSAKGGNRAWMSIICECKESPQELIDLFLTLSRANLKERYYSNAERMFDRGRTLLASLEEPAPELRRLAAKCKSELETSKERAAR